METQNIKGIHQLRRDESANWITENPILWDGQEGYETDTRKRKVGDGKTAWNDLPYTVEVGGRNYFGFNKGVKYHGCSPDKSINGIVIDDSEGQTSGFNGRVSILNLPEYGLYTVSGKVYGTKNFKSRLLIDICDYNQIPLQPEGGVFEVTTTPTKFSVTFDVQSLLQDPYFGFVDFLLAGDKSEIIEEKIYIADLKVEKGNVATDWTPAPEDVQDCTCQRTFVEIPANGILRIGLPSLASISVSLKGTSAAASGELLITGYGSTGTKTRIAPIWMYKPSFAPFSTYVNGSSESACVYIKSTYDSYLRASIVEGLGSNSITLVDTMPDDAEQYSLELMQRPLYGKSGQVLMIGQDNNLTWSGSYATSGNTITDYSNIDIASANGTYSVAVNMQENGATATISVSANTQVSFSVHTSKSYTLKMADGVADLSGEASGRLVYTLRKMGNIVYINGALYA